MDMPLLNYLLCDKSSALGIGRRYDRYIIHFVLQRFTTRSGPLTWKRLPGGEAFSSD